MNARGRRTLRRRLTPSQIALVRAFVRAEVELDAAVRRVARLEAELATVDRAHRAAEEQALSLLTDRKRS